MKLGRGQLFLDRGDHEFVPIGQAQSMQFHAPLTAAQIASGVIPRLHNVSVTFEGLEYASAEAQKWMEALLAVLQSYRRKRNDARPFFPKRRTRSMKGK